MASIAPTEAGPELLVVDDDQAGEFVVPVMRLTPKARALRGQAGKVDQSFQITRLPEQPVDMPHGEQMAEIFGASELS